MELNTDYLKKFSQPIKPKVHTKEQALADEIYFHFAKRLPFARLMGMIKRRGHQFVYEKFNAVKQADCKDALSLFIWKVEKEKSAPKSFPQFKS